METYKKNIGDYQKRKDKAESTINGILLRYVKKHIKTPKTFYFTHIAFQ